MQGIISEWCLTGRNKRTYGFREIRIERCGSGGYAKMGSASDDEVDGALQMELHALLYKPPLQKYSIN